MSILDDPRRLVNSLERTPAWKLIEMILLPPQSESRLEGTRSHQEPAGLSASEAPETGD